VPSQPAAKPMLAFLLNATSRNHQWQSIFVEPVHPGWGGGISILDEQLSGYSKASKMN
jgi:hypothetical protein